MRCDFICNHGTTLNVHYLYCVTVCIFNERCLRYVIVCCFKYVQYVIRTCVWTCGTAITPLARGFLLYGIQVQFNDPGVFVLILVFHFQGDPPPLIDQGIVHLLFFLL